MYYVVHGGGELKWPANSKQVAEVLYRGYRGITGIEVAL